MYSDDSWHSSLLYQVFVNFAKDQSDDYHSKDNSVKRKEAVVDITPLSSRQAEEKLAEERLNESLVWADGHHLPPKTGT